MAFPLTELAGVLAGNVGKTGADVATTKQPGFLSELFKNKQFLSMLAGIGSSLNPKLAPVNALTQKALQSGGLTELLKGTSTGDFGKLLSSVLGGQLPDNVNISMDGKGGLTIKAKPKVNSDEGGVGPTDNVQDVIGTINPSTTQTPGPQSNNVGRVYNPFGSRLSGISASDLAVLSPEQIMQALTFGLNEEQLLERSYNDIVNNTLRGQELAERKRATDIQAGLSAEANATDRLNALRQLAESLREAPLQVPGLDRKLTLDEWNGLDTKTKAYSYYAYNAQQAGRPILDFNTWDQQVSDPDIFAIYDKAKDDEGFKDFYLESRKTVYRDPVETAVRKSKEEPWIQLRDPKSIDAELNNVLKDNIDYKLAFGDDLARAKIRAKEAVRLIRSKIALGNGTIDNEDLVNGELIFNVTKPDGSKETIRYAIR